MTKITIPNGEDIVMSREIFEQNPDLFVKMMIGSCVIGRVLNEQANRLERIYDREWVKSMLDKTDWTWEDYELLFNGVV